MGFGHLYAIVLRGGFDVGEGLFALVVGDVLYLIEAGDGVADVGGVVERLLALLREGVGMVVEMLAGKEVERELGEALRAAQGPLYQEMIDEVEPTEGARELLSDLKRAGHSVILASSAEQDEVERYIKLLDASEFVDGYTTSSDVKASKPEPDIVNAAISKAGGGSAVMIGDSTWDCKAATRAKLPSIGVLTGGFSEQELTDAGATKVFDSVEHLREHLSTASLEEAVRA